MNRAERVMRLVKSERGRWVNARQFAKVAGFCSWRTAISDARKLLKHERKDIKNRVRHVGRYKVSEYRLERAS